MNDFIDSFDTLSNVSMQEFNKRNIGKAVLSVSREKYIHDIKERFIDEHEDLMILLQQTFDNMYSDFLSNRIEVKKVNTREELLKNIFYNNIVVYNGSGQIKLHDPSVLHVVSAGVGMPLLFFTTMQQIASTGRVILGDRDGYSENFRIWLRSRHHSSEIVPKRIFKENNKEELIAELISKNIEKLSEDRKELLIAFYGHGSEDNFYFQVFDKGKSEIISINIPELISYINLKDSGIIFFGCSCLSGSIDKISKIAENNNLSVSGAYFDRTFSNAMSVWATLNPVKEFDPLETTVLNRKNLLIPPIFDSMYYINKQITIERNWRPSKIPSSRNFTPEMDIIQKRFFGSSSRFPSIIEYRHYFPKSVDESSFYNFTGSLACIELLKGYYYNAISLLESKKANIDDILNYSDNLFKVECDIITGRETIFHRVCVEETEIPEKSIDGDGLAMIQIRNPMFNGLIKKLHVAHKKMCYHLFNKMDDLYSEREIHEILDINANGAMAYLQSDWLFLPLIMDTDKSNKILEKLHRFNIYDFDTIYTFNKNDKINSYDILVLDMLILFKLIASIHNDSDMYLSRANRFMADYKKSPLLHIRL